MSNNYNFKDAQFDVKSLIHLFNLQGKDLIGLELGVLRAESFCSDVLLDGKSMCCSDVLFRC